MARRGRLDAELVRRGLARSRGEAGELIRAGRVRVAGSVALKPATAVDPADPMVVRPVAGYASRGGGKLAAALDELGGPVVTDRRCLDAGASTGGFTDVLLRRGATHVVAVDVGYGQLAWRLQTDDRVTVVDRTNVRHLTPADIGGPAQLTVADLSFISLTLVLPALRACTAPDGDLLVLVKPQFEVGRDGVDRGGVVTEPRRRATAVVRVTAAASELGLGVAGLVRSALPGPAGNVEAFLWLRADAAAPDPARLAETAAAALS